jgi:trk system potassium uptake protein TrkH
VRADADLGPRYRSILAYAGLVSALCGLFLLAPLALLPWRPEEIRFAHGFLLPGLLLCGGGAVSWRRLRPRRAPVLSVRDGGIIVLIAWIVVPLATAATFALVLDLGLTHACFESVSAWTTTGLSVIDVEQAPRTILLLRSTLQLAGGAGMAILLVTLSGGPLGPGLAAAEGRGDQLVPHVRRSARLVLGLYAGCALLGTFALRVVGMSWFDAVNHSFCAVSTGGFSTRAASIGYWNSPAVEAVLLPLMVLGSTHFQTLYLLVRGRFRTVLRDHEVRTAAVATIVAVPLMYGFVTSTVYAGAGAQARVAVFEVVSALTTTGYSTTSYAAWPAVGVVLLVPLMVVGGGSGCTAGAMKQHRAYLMARALVWEVRRLGLPGRVILDTSIRRGECDVPVGERAVAQVAVFAFAYLLILALGTAVLVGSGLGLQESLFEYASALGTVGLSIGVTGPGSPTPVLWAETAGMILGRLEIFIVIVAARGLLGDGLAWLRSGRN